MKTIKFFLAFTLLLFAVIFMVSCDEGTGIKETEKKNESVKGKIEETTAEETTAEETTIPESSLKEEPYLPEDALITPDADLQEENTDAFGFEKETIWFEIDRETGKTSGYIRCYGIFDDCVVVFRPGNLDSMTTEEIAGYTFDFSRSFVLYAYRDGNWYELEEAYDNGLVSKETIKKAAENHRAVEEYISYLRSLEKN